MLPEMIDTMPSSPAQDTPASIPSRAAIAGHPLHPMMVHFPVAALIGLLGTDLGWFLTGDVFWARMGLWLAGVGAVGGWLASIAGLVDLLTVRQIRRLITGWQHAILAVMMLSVIPSDKYPCWGSPLILLKGSTAMEGLSGNSSAGGGCK